MIQDLRWVVHFNNTKTLQAYDGHVWFDVPSIGYDQEFKAAVEHQAATQRYVHNDGEGER